MIIINNKWHIFQIYLSDSNKFSSGWQHLNAAVFLPDPGCKQAIVDITTSNLSAADFLM
jgi:hypothetical protein